ncbi:hypothetical protein EV130_102148 [Rhizobium azibense]|uniref:Pyrroline-5-carboxylate reductase catalytic N-terminal domain-containing protein n=1 Tax=Rhizobium azibense TaxID=1136135 RepID=A0A4R3RE37_9HYPH|nr:hypothetical protein EV130_102148 [Rhizobium azibense]TCU33773.1 hypothetical protein EV129_11414 [Rhizobium azibense]
MSTGVIGAGNMGAAFARALVRSSIHRRQVCTGPGQPLPAPNLVGIN